MGHCKADGGDVDRRGGHGVCARDAGGIEAAAGQQGEDGKWGGGEVAREVVGAGVQKLLDDGGVKVWFVHGGRGGRSGQAL